MDELQRTVREKGFTRKSFMGMAVAGVGGLFSLVAGIPIVAYALNPVINQPKDLWRNMRLEANSGASGALVTVDTIPVGLTQRVLYENPSPVPWAGATAENFAYLRRTGDREFIAFSPICTHLGCPVNWLQRAEIFLCPCHGSVYNADGSVAGGPAPLPLRHLPVRIVGRHVQIKTQPLPLIND
jgi:menaquinol-cytochrome c reductase iron-sulfur subunit